VPIYKKDIVKSESLYIPHLTGIASMKKRYTLQFPAGTTITSLKYVFLIEDGRWWTMVGAKVEMDPCENFDMGGGYTHPMYATLRGRTVFPKFVPHIGSKYEEEDIERLTYVDGTPNEIEIIFYKAGIGDAGAYEVIFSLWIEVNADQPPEAWTVEPVVEPTTREEQEPGEGMYEMMGQMMEFMMMFMMMGMMMSIVTAMMPAPGGK